MTTIIPATWSAIRTGTITGTTTSIITGTTIGTTTGTTGITTGTITGTRRWTLHARRCHAAAYGNGTTRCRRRPYFAVVILGRSKERSDARRPEDDEGAYGFARQRFARRLANPHQNAI
ncbi:MAG: hypothetical protein E5V79_00535 [Mesorhizobium sp.]|nr:hypothetical protein EJ069_12395 [Mesorhizobium sp. M2A.F.Ca.ET.043.05.1.1]TIV75759.1 MAG: hypothetical protein E5V79_00535 [Mesorhizobium sp.]